MVQIQITKFNRTNQITKHKSVILTAHLNDAFRYKNVHFSTFHWNGILSWHKTRHLVAQLRFRDLSMVCITKCWLPIWIVFALGLESELLGDLQFILIHDSVVTCSRSSFNWEESACTCFDVLSNFSCKIFTSFCSDSPSTSTANDIVRIRGNHSKFRC